MSRRDSILATVSDAVGDLLYYGRKEDEELPLGAIEAATDAGEITVEEIVEAFEAKLRKGLDLDPPKPRDTKVSVVATPIAGGSMTFHPDRVEFTHEAETVTITRLEGEVDRLRKRTHEIAAAKDAEHAARATELAKLQVWLDDARKFAEKLVADWTNDPHAKWWGWTSENNRKELVGLLQMVVTEREAAEITGHQRGYTEEAVRWEQAVEYAAQGQHPTAYRVGRILEALRQLHPLPDEPPRAETFEDTGLVIRDGGPGDYEVQFSLAGETAYKTWGEAVAAYRQYHKDIWG